MLIRSDARNTRPPITQAYTDQVLYLMTDTDDEFKGKGNPDRTVNNNEIIIRVNDQKNYNLLF